MIKQYAINAELKTKPKHLWQGEVRRGTHFVTWIWKNVVFLEYLLDITKCLYNGLQPLMQIC